MGEEKNDSVDNDSDDKNDLPEDSINNETEGHSGQFYRRRRKIKVRKRVRVKKKSSPKKKARKVLETIIWFIVLIAFVVTLVIVFIELDIRSAKTKSKKSSFLQHPYQLKIGKESTPLYKS